MAYFEDIAGGGATFEESLASLHRVLQQLASHNVRLLAKCSFGYATFTYTGFEVSALDYRLAQSRLDPILTYPGNPSSLPQGRRLMGLLIQLSS